MHILWRTRRFRSWVCLVVWFLFVPGGRFGRRFCGCSFWFGSRRFLWARGIFFPMEIPIRYVTHFCGNNLRCPATSQRHRTPSQRCGFLHFGKNWRKRRFEHGTSTCVLRSNDRVSDSPFTQLGVKPWQQPKVRSTKQTSWQMSAPHWAKLQSGSRWTDRLPQPGTISNGECHERPTKIGQWEILVNSTSCHRFPYKPY